MTRTVPVAEKSHAKCGHLEPAFRNAWEWNGDSLTSAERTLWRSRRALVELVDTLLHDECFVASLSEVRSALDRRGRAWQLARRYGINDRRALIAALLSRGAEHDDLEAAGLAMCNVAAAAITSADEPRQQRRARTSPVLPS